MPGEIHVLVTAPDGSLLCGLGAPGAPVNDNGVLSNMSRVITLVSARIEDLMIFGAGQRGLGGVDEVQRFDINGSPGQGKFTLAFSGSEPTAQIAYHPPAGDVQRALEALSTVGTGNVVVTKDGNWGYVCSFQSELGNQNLPQLTADDSQLGGGATITVSTVTEGGPPTGPVQATSELNDSGELMLTIKDTTGAEWTYHVLPAISPDLCEVTFLGRLVAGVPR